MTKIIENLMKKAADKGHAKSGAWEIEQVQGSFIRVKHYGTCIVKIDFTTEPKTVETIEKPSASDKRTINQVLKEFRLFRYPNSLAGFKQWVADCPSFFSSDDVEGTLKCTYDKKTGVFTESVQRVGFLTGDILSHASHYKYNEEKGRFDYIELD